MQVTESHSLKSLKSQLVDWLFAVGDPTDMTQGPLSVVASVKQGNLPVMNAKVK